MTGRNLTGESQCMSSAKSANHTSAIGTEDLSEEEKWLHITATLEILATVIQACTPWQQIVIPPANSKQGIVGLSETCRPAIPQP